MEDDFDNKLKRLNVQAGKQNKILASHVQRILASHDAVMRSYYQQINGSSGADATMSMENNGEQDGEHWRKSVCVNKSQFFLSSAAEER